MDSTLMHIDKGKTKGTHQQGLIPSLCDYFHPRLTSVFCFITFRTKEYMHLLKKNTVIRISKH